MAVHVTDADRDALRACMPELLSVRLGITNLGRSFKCPNPEHDDRDPSAKYYENGNTVHCFGCDKTWDVFQLMGMLDGIEGFGEQAQAVADTVGYHLDGDSGWGKRKKPASRKPLAKVSYPEPRQAGGDGCVEKCYKAYEKLYTRQGDVARAYLHYRGLGDDDIIKYGLGYAKYPGEVMPEFKVYEPNHHGFVIIPFYNADYSEAHYCMARTLAKDPNNKEWRPKGLVTPLWREHLLSSSQPVVYVTEGLLDAMALEKQINRTCMALGGCSNASRFASVLYHTPKELRPEKIVIAMDEDEEGHKTAEKIAHDLDVIGVPHSTMPPYPDGAKDADEWLMNGRDTRWSFDEEELGDGLTPLRRTRWVIVNG